VAVEVRAERAEEARATMLELFPEGFEEVERTDGVELAAYTTAAGEERLWQVFGGASGSDVEPDWDVRWRAFHQPVRVGPLWVGPPWEEPDAGATAVVVDPGRAFGTGAHPTTRLCLELLLEADRGSLLDVGCGSGVLSIAAALVGFGPVLAVDVEQASVEATRENAVANGVDLEVRRVAADETLPPAGIAVANISLEAVLQLPARVATPLLVTSGYLAPERPALSGWERVDRRESGGWAADLHRRA
jgi:ribosomal protein L11 methyltransferase